MSEEFHVHGPHDHEVEHAMHSREAFSSRIAVMTAILATIGALFSYMVGATQNEALLYKNDSAIRRTEASDQWNFYQAKSNKQHLAELAAALVPADKKPPYEAEIERYKQEKKEIQTKAQELEEEAKKFNELSEHSLHPHHRLAQATTMVQIAISIAAITVLTRKRWLFWASGLSAAIGVALWGLAWLGV